MSLVGRCHPLLAVLMLVGPAAARTAFAQPPESIKIADDRKGFVLFPSGRRFVAWGFNYPAGNKLIEDYWETNWPAVAKDFHEMKALGANVVRVHLQVGKFLEAPDKPNQNSLARLKQLIDLAEQTGLYLDLTGLACYRTADVPAWYDALSEHDRWAAQATFWEAVAGVTADRPGVFCLDLINEPLSPGDKRKPGEWYSGKPYGGLDFLQFISLDPAGRSRGAIVHDWIAMLTTAIRRHDPTHPITVGLLPWVEGWGYFSGFVPAEVGRQLDFVCVHIYPEAGKVDKAIEITRRFAADKPVVIEETFALSCSTPELKQYLLESKPIAAGWIGHYDGTTLAELRGLKERKQLTASQSIFLDWLELFKSVGPEMTGESASR